MSRDPETVPPRAAALFLDVWKPVVLFIFEVGWFERDGKKLGSTTPLTPALLMVFLCAQLREIRLPGMLEFLKECCFVPSASPA